MTNARRCDVCDMTLDDLASHLCQSCAEWVDQGGWEPTGDFDPAKHEPMPTPNTNQSIVDLVKSDLDARSAAGVRKYGTKLQAGNGRDAMMDLYQELLDACMYIRQVIEEDRNG